MYRNAKVRNSFFDKNLEKVWSLGGNNHNKITCSLQIRFDGVCTGEMMKKCVIPHAPVITVNFYNVIKHIVF
jgi:hypothetical protein